jgi:hypothetical protein
MLFFVDVENLKHEILLFITLSLNFLEKEDKGLSDESYKDSS